MFSRIGHQGDRRVDALIDRNPPLDEIGFSMVMRLYGHPAVKGIARLSSSAGSRRISTVLAQSTC